jgi:SsrA-binding protein
VASKTVQNGEVMVAPKQIVQNKPKKTAKALAGSTGGDKKIIASNRKAKHDFEILDTYEAGIVLVGSEVKSLRDGMVQVRDAYARVEGHEMLLLGVNISPYSFAHGFGAHIPDRGRKLLMHRWEINELKMRMAQDRLSLLPLSFYFLNGRVKVELALGRGRKTQDKRDALADRDAKMDMDRAMSTNRKAVLTRRHNLLT